MRERGMGRGEVRKKIRRKKRRPLYSFEISTNCVFSSIFEK
jgi:hypothetical protein